MQIVLIRHGKTAGNLEKRYVGTTDEPLCEAGIRELLQRKQEQKYPPADLVITSPLRRCLETAELLYPEIPADTRIVCEGLREMNFGLFEYQNYQELSGNPAYQAWIDGGGVGAFPGGESQADFERRCAAAYEELFTGVLQKETDQQTESGEKTVALVVHGGTIMALMHHFGIPREDYFTWQCDNAQGVICRCGAFGELLLQQKI